MSCGRIFNDYKDEIELSLKQNCAVECELYSIIANMLRETSWGKNFSLRDVSTRRETDYSRRLKGDGGFPDFVVLERVKRSDATKYGCVEIKRPTVELQIDNQMKGHVASFHKVLFTNGLVWQFYNHSTILSWEHKLGEVCDDSIKWESSSKWFDLLKDLDGIEWTK